jgi:AraC family transcriptional regulator
MFNEPHTSTAAAARPKDSLGCLSSQLHKDLELDTGEFKFFASARATTRRVR